MEIKIAKHFKTMVDKLLLQSSNRFDLTIEDETTTLFNRIKIEIDIIN